MALFGSVFPWQPPLPPASPSDGHEDASIPGQPPLVTVIRGVVRELLGEMLPPPPVLLAPPLVSGGEFICLFFVFF